MQKIKSSVFYFLPIIFCFSYFTLQAQDTIKKAKIGLVLSGGGAKGFAHIGVLKEIEKAGIKIDYIGGTSMGAVVGGLYACGYSANQLDSIFRGTNFDELIQDFVPRNNKTFYEKRNDEMYALNLPFKNFKLSVPKGLSKGLYNYNLISKLTHNFRHIRDFNQLKIPFLAIATNVETGKEKVFKCGNLPLVLSASSAFPSLFSPVEIDGEIYIDGGVANNYPVEEVRKMGATIIIGVDVQDGLKTRDEINGATGVLVQISNFQMIEKMKEKIEKTDIYIRPNVEEFTVISFDQGETIIKKGQIAANLLKDKLEKLRTNYIKVNDSSNKVDSLFIKNIIIKGLKNYTRSYVIGKLRFKQGTKINYTDLHDGINNLNATQNFSAINYELIKENESEILVIDIRENPIKTNLKFSLHYDDLYKTGVLINLTQKKLLFKNDVASFDFILGDNFRYNLDYYIDNGFNWSFGFKSRLNTFNKNSKTDFNGNNIINRLGLKTINIDYSDFSNQGYMQTLFANKFLIGTGLEYKYITIQSSSIQNITAYFDKSWYTSVVGFLKYDSFDNKYFPKKGWSFMGDAQYFFSSSDFYNNFDPFTNFKADAAIVQTFYKKFSVKLQTEGGFVFGESTNHVFDFVLGGYGFNKINNFKPFYGYDFLELSGDSYVKASFSIDYEFVKKNHINWNMNYANIGNNIFENKIWVSKPQFSGYGIGYGIETLLGPIEIKHSWSPETRDHFTWFTVGFWF
ncbi:patatin-like phospholipase family protein [Flavobacterium sp.]|uniref:patatin-like phospholipase family protein n=1 Tax=Flavobacterium sp. TaxID=239 RepID=UPI00286EA61B|nr:patatin-like phospholipase family protein [Flavobacterium sp.]